METGTGCVRERRDAGPEGGASQTLAHDLSWTEITLHGESPEWSWGEEFEQVVEQCVGQPAPAGSDALAVLHLEPGEPVQLLRRSDRAELSNRACGLFDPEAWTGTEFNETCCNAMGDDPMCRALCPGLWREWMLPESLVAVGRNEREGLRLSRSPAQTYSLLWFLDRLLFSNPLEGVRPYECPCDDLLGAGAGCRTLVGLLGVGSVEDLACVEGLRAPPDFVGAAVPDPLTYGWMTTDTELPDRPDSCDVLLETRFAPVTDAEEACAVRDEARAGQCDDDRHCISYGECLVGSRWTCHIPEYYTRLGSCCEEDSDCDWAFDAPLSGTSSLPSGLVCQGGTCEPEFPSMEGLNCMSSRLDPKPFRAFVDDAGAQAHLVFRLLPMDVLVESVDVLGSAVNEVPARTTPEIRIALRVPAGTEIATMRIDDATADAQSGIIRHAIREVLDAIADETQRIVTKTDLAITLSIRLDPWVRYAAWNRPDGEHGEECALSSQSRFVNVPLLNDVRDRSETGG